MHPRNTVILFVTFSTLCLATCSPEILKDKTGTVQLHYNRTRNGIDVELVRNGKVRQFGKLGVGKNFEEVSCIGDERCKFGNNEQLSIQPLNEGFNISWTSDDITISMEDCYNLSSDSFHWYGGPERHTQVWPLEKMTIDGGEPYIIKRTDHFAVAERYWLNSYGVYFWIDDTVTLWIDQNHKYDDEVCFKAQVSDPYINRWRVSLVYIIGVQEDPKKAHLEAINTYLGKPQTLPNEKMITEPIWTTWAKYKRPINDTIVIEFASDIRSHGYLGGQLEIDDQWETCYGSKVFDSSTKKFADISNTVATLHNDNWRVSLWIHPFVDDDCQNNSLIGQQSGYFVRNPNNETQAAWWHGNDSHQVDFTIPEAAEWWSSMLRNLQQNPGIDSFKFDAGESNYANQPNVFREIELAPNILTQKFVETCVKFGDLIEIRTSFRGQQYGKFIRMLDKDSSWTINNGLPTLITTLLQFNMNGYGMVLPDMIGGNGYSLKPTGDLIVRWTQANTFMPTMQFSYLPWDFKDQVVYDIEAIVKNYVDLHAKYAPNIIKAMEKSISDGTPVNPPIWWIDPTDEIALASADEYLLGEEILVAPIIVEGALSRNVYLPQGQWLDGNDGVTLYTGPITLTNYSAPIEVLPWFIKQQ